jgi:hypothetical protein
MTTHWKKPLAAGLTFALLVGVFLAIRPGQSQPATAEPEDCLQLLFESARGGDVTRYLNCFAGPLREQIETDARQQSWARFAAYLQEQTVAVVGRAIKRDTAGSGADRVRLVVERVYARQKWERQGYRLERVAGQWRIIEIEPAEPFEPPVPYGTPAYAEDRGGARAAAAPPQAGAERGDRDARP